MTPTTNASQSSPLADGDLSNIQQLIDAADAAYHDKGEPIISDHEYDQLKDKLAHISPMDPRLAKVGQTPDAASPLSKVRHQIMMGSTFKCNTEEEFKKWHDSMYRKSVVATLKLDGLSLALHYVKGGLVRAVTRGDGEVGEDITHNARLFKGVPAHLTRAPTRAITNFSGVIRGEVVLSVSDWKVVDPEQESNPRNLAAGMARRLDSEGAEHLTFVAFDVQATGARTKGEQLYWLNQHGLETPRHEVLSTSAEVVDAYDRIQTARPNLPYWIDANALSRSSGCTKSTQV